MAPTKPLTLPGPLARVATALRRRFCSHVFRGVDLRTRDADGLVSWSCCRCGKPHRLAYGLLAPGRITGPWSSLSTPPETPPCTPPSPSSAPRWRQSLTSR